MGDDDSNALDDDSRSFSSTSEKGGSDGNTQTSESSNASWSLAKKEIQRVNRSKVLLLGVMVIATAVLRLCVFLVADEDGEDDFRAAFNDHSFEIKEVVHNKAQNIYTTTENVATTLTLSRVL